MLLNWYSKGLMMSAFTCVWKLDHFQNSLYQFLNTSYLKCFQGLEGVTDPTLAPSQCLVDLCWKFHVTHIAVPGLGSSCWPAMTLRHKMFRVWSVTHNRDFGRKDEVEACDLWSSRKMPSFKQQTIYHFDGKNTATSWGWGQTPYIPRMSSLPGRHSDCVTRITQGQSIPSFEYQGNTL